MTYGVQFPLINSGLLVSDVVKLRDPSDVAIFWPALPSVYNFQVQAAFQLAPTSAQYVPLARQTGSLANFPNVIATVGMINLGDAARAVTHLRVIATQSFMLAPTTLAVAIKTL